jgi:PTS system fructose-specific IIA component
VNILELLHDEAIFLPLEAGDKFEVIKTMVQGLAKTGSVQDASAYEQAVLTREATGSTGIGFHVAIPHGKSDGVVKPALAFAKLATPTEWASLDGNPVTSVFMIAVPAAAASNEHLQILIALSRKLMNEEFRENLQNIATVADLKALLADL